MHKGTLRCIKSVVRRAANYSVPRQTITCWAEILRMMTGRGDTPHTKRNTSSPNSVRLRYELLRYLYLGPASCLTIDQICRLYWCLIDLIAWRYSQSCWYFRPLLWASVPLTFSVVHLPPPPPPWVKKYMGTCKVKGGGGDRGPQTVKHLPPSALLINF